MKPRLALVALIAAAVAGCTGSIVPTDQAAPSEPERTSPARGSAARGAVSPLPSAPPETSPELHTMSAYEVRESAISDFGMSVKTNFDVKWGGDVEWMLVTAVAAGSSAAQAGLLPRDRILAIDGRPIGEMNRDAMLEALFQRKKGETSRVLVLGHGQALPRFVTLMAGRP